jgi:hypothetical protein
MPKGRNKVHESGAACMFCGDPADSREHVFGQWLQEFVESDLTGNHKQGITRFDATGGTYDQDATNVQVHGGGFMTRKLPVVCAERCNGGWMSRLEKTVKPWLGPMVQGQKTNLDSDMCRLLALWAEKTAMVWETTDDQSVTATQADRDYLRVQQRPTPHTEVWIGHNGSPEWISRPRHFHGGAVMFDEHGTNRLLMPEQVRLRWDVIGIGEVVLLVSGASQEDARINPPGLSSWFTRIWPYEDRVAFPPPGKPLLLDQGLMGLSDLPGFLAAQNPAPF